MIRSIARRTFPLLAWAYVAALGIQLFTAGLYVFAGTSHIELHRNFAHVIGVLTILLVLSALVGRVSRADRRLTFGVIGLLMLQGMLVHVHQWFNMPAVAALHPVNAVVLSWAALTLARRSGAYRAAAAQRAGSATSSATADLASA